MNKKSVPHLSFLTLRFSLFVLSVKKTARKRRSVVLLCDGCKADLFMLLLLLLLLLKGVPSAARRARFQGFCGSR